MLCLFMSWLGKEYTQKRALEQHMRHHSHVEFPNYGPQKHGVVSLQVSLVRKNTVGNLSINKEVDEL